MKDMVLYNKYFGDSIVIIWHGGRGGGKTLSMTADAVMRMLLGGNVWSNYPIGFKYIFEDGYYKEFRSKKLELDDLVYIQQRDELRDGAILLDEWNLWCNSRRSGANFNILFNGITQQIRKRNLTFSISTQSPDTLDKQIRWQCDLGIHCSDSHFKYRNLPKGQVIRQKLTDFSGVFTGHELSNWYDPIAREKNSWMRLLRRGGLFHSFYDTGFQFNMLEVMSTRYSWKVNQKVITFDDEGSDGFRGVMIKDKINELANILPNGTVLTKNEMRRVFEQEGIEGDMRGNLGKILKEAGFNYHRRHNGDIYYKLDRYSL